MPEVTMIPASIARISAKASTGVQCRRVAAYARVSTDSEEQLTSYEAQVDHYTKYIQSREDWIFVGIYTDVDRSYGQNPKARECLVYGCAWAVTIIRIA